MSKDMDFSCIRCDEKIEFDETLKTIKGAVDLIAYAHSGSEHDFTNDNYAGKQIHFCICDDCYKKARDKNGNKFNLLVQKNRGY